MVFLSTVCRSLTRLQVCRHPSLLGLASTSRATFSSASSSPTTPRPASNSADDTRRLHQDQRFEKDHPAHNDGPTYGHRVSSAAAATVAMTDTSALDGASPPLPSTSASMALDPPTSTSPSASTSVTQSTSSPDSNSSAVQSSAAVTSVPKSKQHQRIWMPNSSVEPLYWNDDVVSRNSLQQPSDCDAYYYRQESPNEAAASSSSSSSSSLPANIMSRHPNLATLLDRIERQEVDGGRMRARQFGVLHEDPTVDMRLLVENYTVASLASALRDREEMLQMASQLAKDGEFELLQRFLKDCHPDVLLEKRRNLRRLDLSKPLNTASLETIRKGLMRMPRRVTTAHSRRAGVVIPLVHVDGVPSILLEKRSPRLRAHPDEVCLPGGMVCEMNDSTIVETCLREMKEEVGGFDFEYHTGVAKGLPSGRGGVSVLGILRCNWGEVHHLVGVAVTPVVCFFNQDLDSVDLKPNPDEVAEVFTIPLTSLLDKSQWIYKDDHAPIFVGGPYVIFGLTGYILERFWKDILLPFHSHEEHTHTFQHGHGFESSRGSDSKHR